MATYNGEQFIEKQLDSILIQLTSEDEVIIVDDNSFDQTVEIIEKITRKTETLVRTLVNPQNVGPIKSFERAISQAKGEVIFLADQDDQWLPDKVTVVMEQFQKENAQLVIHDAIVIDGQGQTLSQSWNKYNENAQTTSIFKTLFKNGFTGCMMAFTEKIAQEILPFPSSIEMHDQWIALVAIKNKDKITVINQPLMNYVRHGGNVTGISKRSKSAQINGRLKMLKLIITYKKKGV